MDNNDVAPGMRVLDGGLSDQNEDTQSRRRFRLTDRGNAERIAEKHGDVIRWCRDERRWYYWNGRIWERDTEELSHLQRFAFDIVDDIWAEAEAAEDEKTRNRLLAHAKSSESAGKLRSVFSAVQAIGELSIRSCQFDSDPWLLNCRNGTLDLRTGQLHNHSRTDLITKTVAVDFDPTARCGRWKAALNTIFAEDAEMIRFLQTAIGYAAVGTVPAKAFFLLYGPGGNNGKNLIIDCLRKILGDYAAGFNPNTILAGAASGPDKPRSDIFRLRGVRLAVGEETERGRQLSESLVKQFTGGPDTLIAARPLHSNEVTFVNQTTLFLSTNHRVLMSPTKAMLRRLNVIPFNIEFVELKELERRLSQGETEIRPLDDSLSVVLVSEASGILNWIVEGCLRWQKQGLVVPVSAERAKEKYLYGISPVHRFLDERCVLRRGDKVQCKDLYDALSEWCRDNGETCPKRPDIRSLLAAKGVVRTEEASTGGRFYYLNVALRGAAADS